MVIILSLVYVSWEI